MVKYLPTSQAASQYIGLAKVLYERVKAKGIEVTNKPYTLDGVLYLVTVSKLVNKVIIITEPTGFVFHPHATTDYPLIDDDGGTRLIFKEETWDYDPKPNENYGNIDWKGTDSVLTWKGPPSRHFALNPLLPVPGLTVVDEEIEVDGLPVVYYTPFGPSVYEGGEILATPPPMGATTPKVLGACYQNGILTVMVGTNYRGMVNPGGAQGGFFYELWQRGEEWQCKAFTSCSRQLVPWFFNQSGTEASCVQDGVVWKCVIGDDVTFSSSAACTGSVTSTREASTVETGMDIVRPALWDYVEPSAYPGADTPGGVDITITMTRTKSQDCIAAIDYKGDMPVTARLTLTSNDRTEGKTHNFGYSGMLEEFPYDPPSALGASYSRGADAAYSVGQQPLVPTGGCAPFLYSASGVFTVNPNTGAITSISCITGAEAGGSITITDQQGATVTKSVRLNVAGTWVRIAHNPCSGYTCSDSGTACPELGWNYQAGDGTHPNWTGTTAIGTFTCVTKCCGPSTPLHSCGLYTCGTETFQYRCS